MGERNNKEKMITYLVQERQAKMRMAESYVADKEAYPYRHKKKIASTVKVAEVPDYNAWGTMKNEWCQKKHHFQWRRAALKDARKKGGKEEGGKEEEQGKVDTVRLMR